MKPLRKINQSHMHDTDVKPATPQSALPPKLYKHSSLIVWFSNFNGLLVKCKMHIVQDKTFYLL